MPQKIDAEQVRKVAKLSRLDLSDAEIAEFTGQLGAILEYVEKMNELDTADVEPLAHCLPISNAFRADEIIYRPDETVGLRITHDVGFINFVIMHSEMLKTDVSM